MLPKYSAQERLKLIERVILGGEAVSKICQEANISRVLFYRWLHRYRKAPGEIETLSPGRRKKPVPKIHKTYHKLTPEEKIRAIQRVISGEEEVADVCHELGISRTIFYRWKKRYEEAAPEEKARVLVPQIRHITRYWRQAPEKYEQAVLDLVRQHPEYGIRNLVTNLPQVAGVPIVGHHGVQNILRRHYLSLYEQRLAYSQTQVTPVIKGIAAWEQAFARFFILPVEARQAIIRFVGATALSLFTTVIILGILGYLATVFGQAAPSSRPGLIFASIALLVGSFFFLYSMKYYFTLALVLSFSTQTAEVRVSGGSRVLKREGWLARIFGLQGSLRSPTSSMSSTEVGPPQVSAGGLQPNLDHIKLERYPFISIHLPFYNEKKVANRIISACTSFDYPNYEVIVCDDSSDETVEIVKEWENHPRVKVLHRPTREGFKGGALSYALKALDPRTEFVCVFDADFVPYPDTLTQFMKYYKATGGWSENLSYEGSPLQTMPYQTNEKVEINPSQQKQLETQVESIRAKNNIAVVAGYQWHVLNKSENWITRGVRTEYAGSYVIERPGQEILGAMKIIHGSVYCMRADVLKHFGWGTSITEDYELTLRIYEKGFKVVYTPYIQAPSECVSTIKRLIRQRMRWAEGHSYNTRKMFAKLFSSPHLTLPEKAEFLYLAPYYLQAAFFLLGTFSWLISETVFRTRLPFWTDLWGWSLVLTNFFALPLMNAVGLFLEESEEKDYIGLLSFVALCYIVTPFQAYAAIKGFIEPQEGTWFRTPKTGNITDIFSRGRFYRWLTGIFPFRPATGGIASSRLAPEPALNPYFALATANNRFASFKISRRQIRLVGRIFLVLLLILSTSLISLGFTITPLRGLPPGIEELNSKKARAEVKVGGQAPEKSKKISLPIESKGNAVSDKEENVLLAQQTQVEEIKRESLLKKDFRASETPQFTFNFPQEEKKKGFFSRFFSLWEVEASGDDFSFRLFNPEGKEENVELEISHEGKEGFKVKVPQLNSFTPGLYKLEAEFTQEGKLYRQEQDFSWGVLAINTNKSIYLPEEEAKLALAVLDEQGKMVCDALLKLKIKNEKLKIYDELSTENGKIIVNPECQVHDFTLNPDYEAQYQVGEAGIYEMELVAQTQNGTYTINDSFEVRENVAFDIERETATRIYPLKSYPVTLKIKANQDFKGIVEENVPADFDIKTTGGQKVLTWQVDWEKGNNYEIAYEFDAPDISPQFYLLGPLELYDSPSTSFDGAQDKSSGFPRFSEARQWQIAADAVTPTGVVGFGETAADDNMQFLTYTSPSTYTDVGNSIDVTAQTNDIFHAVVKAAPTRDEVMSGQLKAGGLLNVTKCIGGCDAAGDWSEALEIGVVTPAQTCDATAGSCEQAFDMAYEQLSGRTMVAYGKAGDDGEILYRLYDGSSWTGETSFTFTSSSTADTRWVRLVADGERLTSRRSNKILLLVEDANSDIFAAIWNGAAFENLTTITTNASVPNRRPFDGAWETLTGNAVVVYGEGTANTTTPFLYKKFNGTSWDSTGSSVATLTTSIGAWVEMSSDPQSNRIAAALESFATGAVAVGMFAPVIWKADGSTGIWTLGNVDTSLENPMAKGVAVAWEKYNLGTSFAMFVDADDGNADVSDYETWTAGAGTGTFLALTDMPLGGGDDANTWKLYGAPNSDEMMAMLVDIDSDLCFQLWNGSAWDADCTTTEYSTTLPPDTTANKEMNSLDFAYRMYSPWSRNWRWSNDISANQLPATWLAAENTAPTGVSTSGYTLRLRFNFAELANLAQINARKKLQYSTDQSTWTDVGVDDGGDIWRYNGCPAYADDALLAGGYVLTGSGQYGPAWENGTAASANGDQTALAVMEVEYCIESNSAASGTTYYFRAWDNDQQTPVFYQQTPGSTYLYPSLQTAPGSTNVDETHYRWRDDVDQPRSFSFTNPASSQFFGHTEPDVIKVGETYYLYYRTDSSIGVASSTDGASWTDYGTILRPTPRGENLVANSHVEFGAPDNWTASANTSWSTTEARSPTHSLQINVTAASADWRSAGYAVTADKYYYFGAYLKGTISANEFFLTIRWFSDAGCTSFISENNLALTTGTYSSWTLFADAAKAPTGALCSDFIYRAVNGTGTPYGDDFFVRESYWDSNYAIAPSAYYYNGTYYLFWEGNNGDCSNCYSQIGYATATNPLGPFVKSANNPILSPQGSGFENWTVGTPVITRYNSKWYLFYHGYDGTDRGGLAWSTDLTSWTRHSLNPILPLGAADTWDDSKTAPSSVILLDDYFYLFYEGDAGGDAWKIGVAYVAAANLESSTLTKHASNPILSPSSSGNWDDAWVQLPGIIKGPGSDELWLYYSGNDGSSFSLGRATESSAPSWWKAAEDASLSNQNTAENVRVRFSVKNSGAQAASYNYRLEVAAKTADTCDLQATGWATVPNQASCGASVACMTTSSYLTDDGSTTNLLTVPTGLTWANGKMVENTSYQTTAITLDYNYFTEVEYNFQFASSATNGTYCFRVTNAGVALNSYNKKATIVIIPEKIWLFLALGLIIPGFLRRKTCLRRERET